MPELPEIALYAQDLNSNASSRKLRSVNFPNRGDWGEVIVPAKVVKAICALQGSVLNFSSFGKGLFLNEAVEFRLGMSGKFHTAPPVDTWKRHVFVHFEFDNLNIFYSDPRRFGRVVLNRPDEAGALGGYNRSKGFWINSDFEIPRGYERQPRISWLLGNGKQTGVGNYIANEALGRLNLSPFEACVDSTQAVQLLQECQKVAMESFQSGGNTFDHAYVQLNGRQGNYIEQCQFYGRENVPRYSFRGRSVFTHFKLPRSAQQGRKTGKVSA